MKQPPIRARLIERDSRRPAPPPYCPEQMLPAHRALARLEDLLDQHRALPPGTRGALENLRRELDALAAAVSGRQVYFAAKGVA